MQHAGFVLKTDSLDAELQLGFDEGFQLSRGIGRIHPLGDGDPGLDVVGIGGNELPLLEPAQGLLRRRHAGGVVTHGASRGQKLVSLRPLLLPGSQVLGDVRAALPFPLDEIGMALFIGQHKGGNLANAILLGQRLILVGVFEVAMSLGRLRQINDDWHEGGGDGRFGLGLGQFRGQFFRLVIGVRDSEDDEELFLARLRQTLGRFDQLIPAGKAGGRSLSRRSSTADGKVGSGRSTRFAGFLRFRNLGVNGIPFGGIVRSLAAGECECCFYILKTAALQQQFFGAGGESEFGFPRGGHGHPLAIDREGAAAPFPFGPIENQNGLAAGDRCFVRLFGLSASSAKAAEHRGDSQAGSDDHQEAENTAAEEQRSGGFFLLAESIIFAAGRR